MKVAESSSYTLDGVTQAAQSRVARTTEHTTHALTAGECTRATAMVVVYLPVDRAGVSGPTDTTPSTLSVQQFLELFKGDAVAANSTSPSLTRLPVLGTVADTETCLAYALPAATVTPIRVE